MQKKLVICLFLLFILCFIGCGSRRDSSSTSPLTNSPSSSVMNSIPIESSLQKSPAETSPVKKELVLPDNIVGRANGDLFFDIPELGLKHQLLIDLRHGKIMADEYNAMVLIMGNKNYGDDTAIKPFYAYIVVKTDHTILFYDLNDVTLELYFELCDMDGDGLDEIVLHYETGGNGGMGQHTVRVLKVVQNKIVDLYCMSYEDYKTTTLGFHGELQDGYKIKITNEHTNLEKTVDLKTLYEEEWNRVYFDSDGRALEKKDLLTIETAYSCKAKDIDDDGIYELQIAYYTYFEGRGNDIGTGICTWKYNSESKKFEIIDAAWVEGRPML